MASESMEIITVNVYESYLKAIEKLVGDHGLYPSRSELVRVACREFLKREIKEAKRLKKQQEEAHEEEIDKEKYVQIPVEKDNGGEDPTREFKTYKIIRKLEF
jgi:Arc/MetJ-type ribon-helix-helix transcriptional regulator